MTTILFAAGCLITILFGIEFIWLCGINDSVQQIQLQIADLKKSREQQEYFNEQLLQHLSLNKRYPCPGYPVYELVEGRHPTKLDALLEYFGLEFNKTESKPATFEVREKEEKKL